MSTIYKDFRTIRLCLKGRLITMYSSSDSSVVARYIFDDETKAESHFMWQCELLGKGNNKEVTNGVGKLCCD